jgi:nucleoside phosphorylase
MKIVILTPIAIEYRAVRQMLEELQIDTKNDCVYETGRFRGKYHLFSVTIRLCGSKNANIALATEKAVQHWQPDMVLLTGIAGGVKDVQIGDVVVGTKAYGYEAGKETPEGFVTRPEVYPGHPALLEQIRSIALTDRWQESLDHAVSFSLPNVLFGPIASGDKVIASKNSPVFQLLKQTYNDTTALEMESVGFAGAMAAYPDIPAANIRGISDLLDDKHRTDNLGGQEKAMQGVVAFLSGLFYQLDFSKLKKKFPMDAKKIAQHVVSLLFPLLKLDSVQQIGQEFKEATDSTILEIWEKVKPVFIEEIGAEDDPNDAQVAIRSSLRKELIKREPLKKELISLLRQAQEKNLINETTINISNSKNVVQGSTIKVKGDFHLGDNINT